MDLQRAKELLSGLADGVDPLTGEVLPEDHVCNKAEIIRAFHCVLKALPGKPVSYTHLSGDRKRD